jgi:dipeptidyl aminopeptidase/acylaminoacyl peptidase
VGWSVRPVAVVLLVLLGVLAGCQLVNRPSGPPAVGRIVWPKDGDLWVYDLVSKQQTRITQLPAGAAVTGATWSPDGQQIIFAQFGRRPNERASGADLMLVAADGSNPTVYAERDAANTVLETPEWAPSGRVYYTVRRVANSREATSVVRQAAAGAAPEVLAEDAYSPAISPDEQTLVFVRSTRAGQTMQRTSLASGETCELISDQVFQYLSLPRISPDGSRVAFGGSGEPNLQASGCGGDTRARPAAAPSLDLRAVLVPGVAHAAEAHGLPADIYTISLADGGNLVRIADIKDDDPTVAWSPDGGKVAIFGVAALYSVDSQGGAPEKLVDQGGYGGLDWTK